LKVLLINPPVINVIEPWTDEPKYVRTALAHLAGYLREKIDVEIKVMLQSIKDSHKAGINVKLNMIIGFPKETHLDIFYTWLFLIKCSWYGAYDALPGTFSAYPGTELFNYLVSQKKINYSEEFYFNVIRSSSITGSHNYSEKIGKNFIKFYFWFLIVSFYSSNYLFRPIRIINTISNLVTKKYNSRAEQALGRFLFR
jgi:anaerobic magnesium-protoporphyrin IX monomethyl ester cyclase